MRFLYGNRFALAQAAILISLILGSLFVLARPAYAALPTLAVAVGTMAIGDLIALVLATFLVDICANFLAPLAEVMFEWSTDYTTIPYVNLVILGLQILAIVAVIAIRIGVGISSGILLRGGNREASLGEYLYRSIIAVVIVALMPMLCRTVIDFGVMMYNGITGNGGSLANKLEWFKVDDLSWSDEVNIGTNFLWLMVGIFLMLILCFAVGYQFMRRQIEMITVSLIAPIVSVLSATENDSDQPIDLLKRLFGMCCTQWIQYILCMVAVELGIAWISAVLPETGMIESLESVFSGENTQLFLLSIAAFGAALTVPALVDQYTFGGGGSRIGGLVVGTLAGSAIRGTVSAPGKQAATVTRTARK